MPLTRREHALILLDDLEGGYSNTPGDTGGPTKYGVTLATLRRWRKNPNLTAADVKALTHAEAAKIYIEGGYWQEWMDDLDVPACVAVWVFVNGVNTGPARAVKLAQAACGIQADGIVGPMTIAALCALRGRALRFLEVAGMARHDYDAGLHNFAAFGRGWTRRLIKTTAYCATLIEG
jgi:lysozyme family protein